MSRRHDSLRHRRGVRVGFGLIVAVGLLSGPLAVQAGTTWVSTRTRAHPVNRARFRAYLAGDEPLNIAVALKLRNREKLTALIHTLTKPGDPASKHWLSAQQVQTITHLPRRARKRLPIICPKQDLPVST